MDVTSTAPAAKPIPQLRARFYWPLERILRETGNAYEHLGDVIQVTGLPAKVFCFRNPDHIGSILRHPQVGMTKFTKVLPRVKWVMGNGGYILRGGTQWKERRSQVQAAFKRQCLVDYSSQVPEITARWLQSWHEHADRGTVFDVYEALQTLITDIDLQIFFSKALAEEPLERVRKQTHFVEAHFVELTPLWLPTPQNLQFRRYARQLREFMLELIRERKANPEEKADLLSVLFEIKDAQTGQAWSDKDIVDEMFSVYFGASVMSVTLAWAFYLIASHPHVQEKLAAELNDVLNGRDPRVEDLDQLPYTNMVLQETLRLYPGSWGYPRYCDQELDIDDYRIPAGSLVIPMAYHVHRHPDHWQDLETFDPERFNEENSASIPRFAHIPFGAGARTCLGANLAPMVIRLVIATVCQRFKLAFKPRFPADPVTRFAFEILPKDRVLMSVSRR